MDRKDLRVTKGILVNGSYNIGVLARNDVFYKNILSNKKNISTMIGESRVQASSESLVYDTSNRSLLENETIQTIMDLLLQLRAAQSDQNVFVQNNTVVRQQILDQLKREISQVQNNLTQNQVQQLKVVSNNLFDEDTLNKLIKSLLKDTKKKLAYSWDEQSNNVLVKKPEVSSFVEDVVKSVKPVDVIKKYQTILSNTINNFSTEKIFHKNNLVNRTEVYDKQPLKETIVVREVRKPIEITTDEFITKENLIENIEKVYNERLVKRLDVIPQVTKTFLKTLEFGGIRNYKEVVSTIWDKVYLKKELPKATILSHRKVTDKTNEVEILQNSIDTYFNKVLIQDVTGLTLYKEIRSAYRNKKIELKNILVNNKNKDFIETDIVKRYNTLTLSTNEKVYKNKLISESNLINKISDKIINERENVVKRTKASFYETEVEKVYKKSVFNTDVKNENRIAKIKLENEFTNKIENISKKTAEIVTNNKLINRYDNIVENVIEHVHHDILEKRTNKVQDKTIKYKDVKVLKDNVRNIEHRNIVRELEKSYQDSAFNNDIINNVRDITRNTAEIVTNNRLINRYDNIVEKVIEHIHHDILEKRTNKVQDKTIKYKDVKVLKDNVRNIEHRNIVRELERNYQDSFINNEFINNVRDITKKTAEIVTNNRLINRYDNIVENVIEHVHHDILEKRTNKIQNKTLKYKDVKNIKGTVSNVEQRNIIRELEKNYQDSIFNVENLREKLLSTKTVSRLRNQITNLDIINEDHIYSTIKQNQILNRYNKLISDVRDNVVVNREIDKTVLINKDATQNNYLSEELKETQEISIREVRDKFTKLYKDTVLNLENTIDKSVVNKINQNVSVNKLIKTNSKLFRNIGEDKFKDEVELINKVLVENINIPKESVFVNKVINEYLEKDVINKIRLKTKNINSLEKNNLIEVNNYSDIINENNKKIINKYQDKDIQRVVQKENFINRSIVNNVNILEQLPQIQKIQENIINQTVKNIRKDKIYNKNIEYLEKVLSNNLTQINEEKINEHIKRFKNKVVENLTILNVVKDNVKGREGYNQAIERKYRENLFVENPRTILENIQKIYNINKVIPRKKVNLLPPTILQYRKSTINENNIYRDIEQNELSYYNQMVEDIGRTFVVRDNETLNIDNIIDNVRKQEMVYKEPIRLPQEEPKVKQQEEEKIIKKLEKKIEPVLRQVKEEKMTLPKGKVEKGLTKNDVESIIKSYIRNINVDTISRVVINEVEQKMRLNRRRNGII